MGEDKTDQPRVPNQSLYRKGREADLTKVPLQDLNEAAKRGIRINITSSKPGEVKAQVNKIVVKGDDEP